MNLLKLFEVSQEYQANLNKINLEINNIQWSYYDNKNTTIYETDDKPIIIIFHGFQSNKKFLWYPILKKLTNHFRIIIPDMLGHGDTKILSDIDTFDFSIKHIIFQLKEFIYNVIGKNKQFNLIGSSLGGLFACMLSVVYPKNIISLTLYTTAGISKNNLLVEIYNKNKINLLVPGNVDDLLLLAELVFYNKPYINKFLLRKFKFDDHMSKRNTYLKILIQTILPNITILKNYIKKIKQPILIIWGKYDKILDVSDVEYMKKELSSNVEIHILDRCGHLVHYEYPDICAKYTKFHILRSINNIKKNN